jgi:cyclophilin family peptidyl-prolyl cis-trans isomerase
MRALLVVALFASSFGQGLQSLAAPKDHTLIAGKKGTMNQDPIVEIETSKGNIKIRIFQHDAPITSANFLDLVGKGFYNGLTFHRYEPGFCIQGGDPNGNGTGAYIDPATHQARRIQLEVKPNLLHSEAGIVAMARSQDKNSASCQFYITLGPASFLDQQYAVFGKVVDGMNVVNQIRVGDKMNKVSVLETATK